MTGGKKKLEQERQTWAKEVDSLKSERESLKEERAKQAAEIVRLQEQHTKAGEVERLKEEERGRQEAEIARLTQARDSEPPAFREGSTSHRLFYLLICKDGKIPSSGKCKFVRGRLLNARPHSGLR